MFNPLKGILKEIIQHKIHEVERRKKNRSLDELIRLAAFAPPVRDFHTALKRGSGPIRLLAEIKAASPSTGTIRDRFDPSEIARLYETGGASAISILTDEKYFSGQDEHLQSAKAAVSVPVLRKDFTIDEYQLYESRVIGADAVLLMAQVLDIDSFSRLLKKARELGLHVLAEGHTQDQIDAIVSLRAETIGINNRDFDTMTTDLETTLRLRDRIPRERVLVSQSGISRREEIKRLEAEGIDAVQIGTSIMKQENMKDYLRGLLGRKTSS